jgi:hypothetical protein
MYEPVQGIFMVHGSQGYDLHKNRDFSRDRCSTARIMKNIEKGFIFEAPKR